MDKWFINANNFIKGPFSSDEVQKHIQTLGDEIQSTFLWSRGYAEWVRADKWNPQLQPQPQPLPPQAIAKDIAQLMQHQDTVKVAKPSSVTKNVNATVTDYTQAPIHPMPKAVKPELVESIKNSSVEKFQVQYDFVDQGEMTKEQLTQFTAKQEDVSKISIYDKKTKDWKEIYAFPDIVNKLGISRRKSQRVPILAQFLGTTSSGKRLTGRVITVSAGGMGITDNFELKLGETVQGQLTSPHFYNALVVSAEVTYSGLDGYVGLKFTNPTAETVALITDYIKRFGKDSAET